MLYNDNYSGIDAGMSDSNVGARKGHNIHDHLFVMYAIIKDIINGKGVQCHIQLMDIVKCFDKMWLSECCNDLCDTQMNTENLSLLYEMNKTNKVVIRWRQQDKGLKHGVHWPRTYSALN